ncbi:hypothetical protein GOZ96_04770 [Agrobacterium vitis]|uniref:Uncharacterized protein n=1 Tax=Agrobacterium vitis TaxID=373 RepID=A0A7J4X4K5_AGRVI|nr:hypothetical protein [Agrobacterium vitis]KAA3527056.1 hypothetical protein DXT89_14065 [Agrobacterium vitis]MUZ95902.1 hypothetical protein [Agrobacterium vitis]
MGGLFGKTEKPTVIPTATVDDKESQRIKSQQIADIQARSGRSSTLLSRQNASSGTSGGTQAYSNTKLGQS